MTAALRIICLALAAAASAFSFSLQADNRKDSLSMFSRTYNIDNMLYNLKIHNIRGNRLIANPTGASIAVLSGNGTKISIISNRNRNEQISRIKSGPIITSASYSPGANELLTADTHGNITTYSTDGYTVANSFYTGTVYSSIAVSPNYYYIAAASGNELDIWDVHTGELRKKLYFKGGINYLTFSPDSKEIAVCCDSTGLMTIDVLRYFRTPVSHISENVLQASYHPQGKYIAYAKADSVIVYNLINKKSVYCIKTGKDAEAIDLRFRRNGTTGRITLTYISDYRFSYWDMTSLPPLYMSMVSEEADKLMADWVRQMDGESMEEYRIRVTDDNAARQRAMLLDQAATAIAARSIKLENPFIAEQHDSGNHTIDIKFKELNPIRIEVPEEEFDEIRTGDLLFENPVYTLDGNDEFQLVYLEVINRTTDKTYIFDRRSYIIEEVEFDEEEESLDFIPVAMIQAANMEMEALQMQTQQIMEEKRQENVITDKTEITISSEIQSDVDADGNKIYNYLLGYRYDVSEGFSYQEDFGPGKFMVTESNAALTMLEAIRSALAGDMGRYLEDAAAVDITITGTADAIPVGRIPYDGSLGEFRETPYYAYDELASMTVTDESDIRDNEQLAFIRAAGVKKWLETEVEQLRTHRDKCSYHYRTEVSNVRGGEFRRIIVQIRFRDIF